MRLKELRLDHNYTQNDVAKAINTSQRNIGRWENGDNEPTASFLILLADFFNVTIDYLMEREDDFGIINTAPHPTAAAMGDGMTEKEKTLLEAFRNLLPETQDFVLRSAQSLRDKKSVT